MRYGNLSTSLFSHFFGKSLSENYETVLHQKDLYPGNTLQSTLNFIYLPFKVNALTYFIYSKNSEGIQLCFENNVDLLYDW